MSYNVPVTPSKMLGRILKNGEFIFEEPMFRNLIEDHLPLLRADAQVHKVEPLHVEQFKHDLMGYLYDQNIHPGSVWIIMRLNDKQYNWEFDEQDEYLLIPEEAQIDQLIGQYQATRN